MTLSIYSTAAMVAMVASLKSRNRSTFMLDTFFRDYVPPTGQEEVTFDIEDDSMGIAPFVSPLREGKIIAEDGWAAKSMKPAYIKPKMAINPFGVVRRALGEAPAGVLTPAQREAAAVARGMDKLVGSIVRRLELMAIDTLLDGITTVTGEGYDSVAVNYGRTAGHTVALTSPNRWYDAGVSPVASLDTNIMMVSLAAGRQADIVVMDPKAWSAYEADTKLDKRRDATLNVLPGAGAAISPGMTRAPIKGGILKATLDSGAVQIWVYQQQYKHPSTGTLTNMIPDYSVFIGCSDPECTGTRLFGTILDPELGFESSAMVDPESGAIVEIAPKTWTTKDPAQRWIMAQCAPLTALKRPNATAYMLVG